MRAFFATHAIPEACITGTLSDLTKVTLHGCVEMGHGFATRSNERYESASVYPRYVLFGTPHIAPADAIVTAMSVVIDDATVLFHDNDAFGSIYDAGPLMEHILILTARENPRLVPVGPHPHVAYYAGKRDIIAVETVLGRVSAHHNPWCDLGDASGVRISNTISVDLRFEAPIGFAEGMTRVHTLLSSLDLIIGR